MQFRQEHGLEMREVKVKKSELLNTLRTNLVKHKADYQESVEGFRLKAAEQIARLSKQVVDYKPGDDAFALSLGLIIPVSYEKQYLEIIRLFEMEVEEVVTLKQDEFSRYVMDDWQWKDNFSSMTKMYSSHR